MVGDSLLPCPCLWQSVAVASDIGVVGLQNHIMGRLSMNACLMAGGSSWFVRKRCVFHCASPPSCMFFLTCSATPLALCTTFLAFPCCSENAEAYRPALCGDTVSALPCLRPVSNSQDDPAIVLLLLWLLTSSSCMRSDMSTFFEDIKVARPTCMMIIPRIANMLYDQAQEQIRKAKGANKQVRAP